MKWDDRIGRRLKLHDLHVLLTVAELGSMGKAAERLGVSQPLVSKAIADMEHTIGVRLLDRTPRGVETTSYGLALLRRGLVAFDELRQGIKDIEYLTDPTIGEVRIGCPEPISAGLLSAVIDRFSRQFPGAIVSMTPANDMSKELLRDRKVDFLLGRVADPFTEDDLDAEVLYHDRIYLVSSQNSRWGRRRKIELAELIEAPWLISPTMYGSVLADIFQARGLAAPKICVKNYSTHQAINLLATGRFVTAFSGSLLRFTRVADRFSFKLLPVDYETQSWPVAIVTLKNRIVSPVVQTFIESVREVAKPLTKRKII